VPIKRVQSFEFYGADKLPKPAYRGSSGGDCAHAWERGSERGVYLGHTIRAHVPPFLLNLQMKLATSGQESNLLRTVSTSTESSGKC
jgi:hypothetical protein